MSLRTKVMLLGNARVGKSSILAQFHSDTPFSPSYNMTNDCNITVKTINIPDSSLTVELFVHDVPGHDAFGEYSGKYTAQAHAFVLVFDVANMDSFKSLGKWMNTVKAGMGKETTGVLLANKTDVGARRTVTKDQGMFQHNHVEQM